LLKYTTLAYTLLPALDRPRILDAGCGTGVPTVHLAEISGGTIVAVDTDAAAIAKLAEKLTHKGLSTRVQLMNAPMESLPFDKESFDIVWAEGSISRLGFEAALRLLGTYAKEGGFVVFHDEVGDYLHKISTVQATGYVLLGFFLLSQSVWWDEYYKPLDANLASADSASPPHSLHAIKKELEEYTMNPSRFQSAFFVTQKTRSVYIGADV
jgi:SAM-dependent methyltransferase